MKHKNLIPFLDVAYDGFDSGDHKKDNYLITLLYEMGFQMFVSHTYSKTLGLYQDRIGSLSVVCIDSNVANDVMENLKATIRGIWLTPPANGALIVSDILENQSQLDLWKNEMIQVSKNILKTRYMLRNELEKHASQYSWEHISEGKGIFSYSGLTGNIFAND